MNSAKQIQKIAASFMRPTLDELLDHPELLSKETLVRALRKSMEQGKDAAGFLKSYHVWIASCNRELIAILAGTEEKQ